MNTNKYKISINFHINNTQLSIEVVPIQKNIRFSNIIFYDTTNAYFYSIQVLNVLKAEMSIFGHHKYFKSTLSYLEGRFCVRWSCALIVDFRWSDANYQIVCALLCRVYVPFWTFFRIIILKRIKQLSCCFWKMLLLLCTISGTRI